MNSIAMVMPTLGGGGAERVAVALSRYFIHRGYEFSFLLTKKNECVYELPEGVKVNPICDSAGTSLFAQIRGIRHEMKKDDSRIFLSFLCDQNVYLSGSQSAADMVEGDKVIIYRTTDYEGPAHYRSVVTSVCTVVKVVNLNFFRDEVDFLNKVRGKTVFTLGELRSFWQTKRYPWLIRLLFNFPLDRYPNRKELLDCGFIDTGRLVCERLSQDAMDGIMALGNADESFIVD